MATKRPHDAHDAEVIARIKEWLDLGVNPGGIASALQAEGLPVPGGGSWSAGKVRGILDCLDAQAGIIREAEAVFEPVDEDGGDSWEGHCGKFKRPWLDRTGRDVRDTGCVGEQGGGGGGEDQPDTTFADLAVAAVDGGDGVLKRVR